MLIALIPLELLALFIVLRNSSWVYDDNFFLVLAGQEGFTWHWLTSVQFEHWDIAEHAAISLQHALFFFDYRWALLVMLAILGGSAWLLERVLATFVKSRSVTVALALWFALNILWVRPLQWWAAGVQYLPYTFFELLCLYGFLRYYADRSPRWIAVSGGALAAGLLFYEKPAYMLLYLVLLRVLLMARDLRPRAVLSAFWRERAIWITYLLIIAVWAAGYIHAHAYSSSRGAVGIGQYLTYFRILWLQTLVPCLASVTIPASHLDPLQVAFVVIAQIVVVAGVVLSLRRKRQAWRAWAFLAIVVLANGVLVARSRIGQFGVGIANDPRYLVEYAWLVPLAVCAAFSREAVITPRVPSTSARVALPSLRRAAPAAVVLLLLAYAAGSIASAAHLQKLWAGPQGREWEQNVRHDVAALRRSRAHFVLADNATPFEIMEEFVAPYNRLSRVLPMYVGHVQIDGPLDGTLMRVENDGVVRRAAVAGTVGDGSMLALRSAHELGFGPTGRSIWQHGEACVIADGSSVAITRALPHPPNSAGGPYYALLDYRVWRPTALPVSVDAGPGSRPADHAVAVSPGSHRSISFLGEGEPRSVTLELQPFNTICMSRLDIVSLRNAG
ncbi:MAG TPA: hypothetical protein VHW67_01390 [Solirubrobacteraceae bacterium]|nr:hypothetical protein [Solirubrobacteraceae bacterium]